MGLKKFSLGLMLGALGSSALMCIAMIWFGTDNELVLRILGTTCTMGGFSLTALACSILYEKQQFLPVSYAGLAISAFGLLFGGLLIWEIIDITEGTVKLMSLSIVFSVALAHVSIMLNMYTGAEGDYFKWSLGATAGVIAIIAAMVSFIILDELRVENVNFYNTLWTFSILGVLGTITTPLFKKFEKAGASDAEQVDASSDLPPEKEKPAAPEKDKGPDKQDAPEPEDTE